MRVMKAAMSATTILTAIASLADTSFYYSPFSEEQYENSNYDLKNVIWNRLLEF